MVIPSFGTTKAIEPGQPSLELCVVRAKFLKPEATRNSFQRNEKTLDADAIFWMVDVYDRSNSAICPPLGPLKLRVRGATFRGTTRNPEITYAVDFSQPKANETVELKVEFSKGRDTFTQLDFEEWLLKEQVGD